MTTATTPITAASYERVYHTTQGLRSSPRGAAQSLEDFASGRAGPARASPVPRRRGRGGVRCILGPARTHRCCDAARSRAFTSSWSPTSTASRVATERDTYRQEQTAAPTASAVVYQRSPGRGLAGGTARRKTCCTRSPSIEREKTQRRTRLGRRAKAQAGMVIGQGRPPYGYALRDRADAERQAARQRTRAGPAARRRSCARIFVLLRHRSTAEVADAPERRRRPRAAAVDADVVYDIARHAVYMGQWRYGANHRKGRARRSEHRRR